MPDWACVAGGTLLIPSGPSGHHLFIILNKPKDFDGFLESSVLVSISTIKKASYDDTCVLTAGTHRFIKVDSYVVYRDARTERLSNLENGVGLGLFKPHDPVTQEILDSVRQGLLDSKHTSKYLKQLDFD
ncbi:MAG: hypothetical protein IIA77_09800 [Proteobacteria bacterium]|nr:hypothetical protein [Pseudomonadota bacterium]